jgi:hypothetical protein
LGKKNIHAVLICIEIPSHPSQNDYHQENKEYILARMWSQRNLHTLFIGRENNATSMEISREVHPKARNKPIF